ncbi:MAG: hypothetical protein R3A11_03310 [Bdellovibrionota bacterium]
MIEEPLTSLQLYRWMIAKDLGMTWESAKRFYDDYWQFFSGTTKQPAIHVNQDCSIQSLPSVFPGESKRLLGDLFARGDWYVHSNSTLDSSTHNFEEKLQLQLSRVEEHATSVDMAYQNFKKEIKASKPISENIDQAYATYQFAVHQLYGDYQTQYITGTPVFQKWFGKIKSKQELQVYVLKKARPHPLAYERISPDLKQKIGDWSQREQLARYAGNFSQLPQAGFHIHELRNNWEMYNGKFVQHVGIYWASIENANQTLIDQCQLSKERILDYNTQLSKGTQIYLGNHTQLSLSTQSREEQIKIHHGIFQTTTQLTQDNFLPTLQDMIKTPNLVAHVLNDRPYFAGLVVKHIHQISDLQKKEETIDNMIRIGTWIGTGVLMAVGLGMIAYPLSAALLSTFMAVNVGMVLTAGVQIARIVDRSQTFEERKKWLEGIGIIGLGNEWTAREREMLETYVERAWMYGLVLGIYVGVNLITYFRLMINIMKSMAPSAAQAASFFQKMINVYSGIPGGSDPTYRFMFFRSLDAEELAICKAVVHTSSRTIPLTSIKDELTFLCSSRRNSIDIVSTLFASIDQRKPPLATNRNQNPKLH